MPSAKRWSSPGCLGWMFVWLGVLLLLWHDWQLAWSALALTVGATFLTRALTESGQRGAVFPAVVLIITGAGILLQQQGWISFEMWRVWPLFFASVGLGLVLLWGLRAGGLWALILGGALLFASGYGFASRSWYRYLDALRQLADMWPLILILLGVMLVVGHWRKRAG